MRTNVLGGLLAPVIAIAVSAASTGVAHRTSACTFVISAQNGEPEIAGDNEAARRAWVMTQPDSPLAILRVDLSDVALYAGDGYYSRSGRHVVDVKNISDKVITEAQVMVRVAFSVASGGGSGMKLGRPLQPGEQARIEWKSGSGRGSHGTEREVSVVALVREVQTAACTYRPSQAWPSVASTQ